MAFCNSANISYAKFKEVKEKADVIFLPISKKNSQKDNDEEKLQNKPSNKRQG
jgi:hypothetical protein